MELQLYIILLISYILLYFLECGSSKYTNFREWIVLVQINSVYECSGTIISPDTVLTKASCVYSMEPVAASRKMTIVLKTANSSFSEPYRVSNMHIPALLAKQMSMLDHNIALLKINGTFPDTITPICLMNDSLYQEKPNTVAIGYYTPLSNTIVPPQQGAIETSLISGRYTTLH